MEQKFEILTVDDDVNLASNLQHILEVEGYITAVTQDGQSAITLSREKAFGLAIIDIKLPDIPGLKLVEELAALSPKTEYIIITGYASLDSAIEAAGQRNIVAYETKPLNMDHILALIRQVVERRQAEEQLRKHREHLEELVEERTKELRDAQEQLVRKERLAVLGQLAGAVAHELRNPLGGIKNAAYFLNMALEEPEPEVEETLKMLGKEMATSERIISSLLDFAHPSLPAQRKVDINDVVQGALGRITMPENVEVVSQLDEALPTVLADPDQLGQVFANIILNAIQAMPEGGQLVVKSEVPSPGWVTISFADTGVGIPEENLAKLFEPLFTTRAKGIGLGLAVTKTLIEGHGGTIQVQSEVRKGSTFTVRLPVSRGEEK